MTHSGLRIFHKDELAQAGTATQGGAGWRERAFGAVSADYPGLHHHPRRGRKVASKYSRYSPRIDAAIYLPSRPRWCRNGQSLRPRRWMARSIELRSAHVNPYTHDKPSTNL